MNEVQNITLRYGRFTVSLSNGGSDSHALREVAVFVDGKRGGLPACYWHPDGEEWHAATETSVHVGTRDLVKVLQRVQLLADLDIEIDSMESE